MTVFAIVSTSQPADVEAALTANFPGDFIELSRGGGWLVAARGLTAKDISDKLGITEGTAGSAIVFTTAGYFGRASNQVWEWLAAKLAQL